MNSCTAPAGGTTIFTPQQALDAFADRPTKRADLVRELGLALDAFEADRSIGCIILTGGEKAFAAGADIKEMKDKSYQDVFAGAAQWQSLPIPTGERDFRAASTCRWSPA